MQFQKRTLPNGMRVVVVPMPESLTATVLVLTATGSKYETEDISGVSHFLEHMCYKGTVKRPSAQAIACELDGLGASYNAFTGQEQTGYYAKVEKSLFPQALDVVADIFQNSTLPAEEMEKEKGVIVGEIEMHEDDPQDHVGDIFSELLYGDQPAGWNVAGTRKTVRAMTREKMAEYRRMHYVASATTVIVAGNVDITRVWDDIALVFQNVPQGKKTGKEKVRDSQESPAVKIEFKETKQTHLILGFRSFNVYDKRMRTLRLLSTILGGGMSSRLFERIREKMGAGYDIGMAPQFFTDHGFTVAFTGADNSRVQEVVSAILEEVARTKEEHIPAEELERGKNFIIGNLFSGLETSSSLAQFYGANEVLGKPLKTPQEIAEEIRAVTAEDILQVAREIFVPEHANLALVGPWKDEKEFLPLLQV